MPKILMSEGGVVGGVQEQLAVDCQRGSYPKTLAGAVVDVIGDGIELLLAAQGQISSLGMVMGFIKN